MISLLTVALTVASAHNPEESKSAAASEDLPNTEPSEDQSTLQWFLDELTGSPVNIILLLIILFLIYKLLKPESDFSPSVEVEPPLPPMKKRDFTPRQLKVFDGNKSDENPDSRVLVAVLGKVYDVTKGKSFYGPGGPYSVFAGHDASRGLATFSVHSVSDEYDDLSDLKQSELNEVREWDLQFSEKYPLVGKLLKPGEQPTSYSDDEEGSEDEDAIAEENRKLKRLSSGQTLSNENEANKN